MSKILLIEDDLILRGMYRDKFVHEGMEVETASEGKEGITKMREWAPDVVLLDLLMPGVSGYDVLKLAKGDPTLSKIPILVLTNIFSDAEDMIKNWGATHFILKVNTPPDDIVHKVKQVIAEKKKSK